MKRFPKGETPVVTWIKDGKETIITHNEDYSKYTMYKEIDNKLTKIKTSNDPTKLEKGFWD